MPHRKIVDQFRVRVGSNRDKLATILAKQLGEQLPLREVVDEVYGKRKGSASALWLVAKGLEDIIKKNRLRYEIIWVKRNARKTLGLYPVENEDCKIITQRATFAALNPKGRLTGEDN